MKLSAKTYKTQNPSMNVSNIDYFWMACSKNESSDTSYPNAGKCGLQ